MARFVRHKFVEDVGTLQTNTFVFLAPPDAYAGIGTETGVTAVAATDPEMGFPITPVEELLKSGVAVRKTLRITKNGKKAYSKILVPKSQADTVGTALVGKSVNQNPISAVVTPLDAVFY